MSNTFHNLASHGDEIKVSVIVPVFNASETLSRCLEPLSVLGNTYEVIVVDDASTDSSLEIAQGFPVTVVRSDINVGPGPARNLGVQHSSGDILLFIDADVEVQVEKVKQLIQELRDAPEYSAIFGSYDKAPQAPQLVSQYRNLLHHFVHQQHTGEASHFWTGFAAIRASDFAILGGFSECYYGRQIEDVELGYRMRARGMRLRINPALQVKHLKRWTLISMLKTDLLHRGIPWTRLILTTHCLPDDFSLSTNQRLSGVLATQVVLFGLFSHMYSFALFFSLVFLLGFIAACKNFLCFLAQARGWSFAFCCIPLHLIYYCNACLAFACGVTIHVIDRFSSVPTTSTSEIQSDTDTQNP
ncbi:MAG: glycosyltransferase family 2 protein [Porticoccus sp.]|nr:glycosyltransferase family 2 protein [Porticoccus sp.]